MDKENANSKTNKSIDQNSYLKFLALAGKLKSERRHSWPQGHNQPRESVADHSWRLVLMVMLYWNKLDQNVDLSKCLCMAAIHDLAEALTGDIPLVDQTKDSRELKIIREMKAMEEMLAILDSETQKNFFDIYNEYEAQKSYESKFVKALDKIEAFQQHNEDPLETWLPKEKEMYFQDKYIYEYCKFDSVLEALGKQVIENGIKKLIEGGENIELIKANIHNHH